MRQAGYPPEDRYPDVTGPAEVGGGQGTHQRTNILTSLDQKKWGRGAGYPPEDQYPDVTGPEEVGGGGGAAHPPEDQYPDVTGPEEGMGTHQRTNILTSLDQKKGGGVPTRGPIS